MAASFDKRTPILSYGPRAHVRWGRRRFLLWPAWMFRVLAPRRHQRSLNILQRAVLGLCRAGLHRAEDLGSRLAIARELAAHVLHGLMEQNAVDSNGVPTQTGLSLLENDALDVQEQVSGHVFQDPWTLELWPRMVLKAEPQDVEYTEAGSPRLRLGTKGSPRPQPVHPVFPNSGLPPAKPRPEQILQASTQHRRTRRGRRGWEPDPDDIGFNPAPSAPLIERTSLIGESRAVFLVTYLYLPEDQAEGTQWSVCDPFGLGASPSLRETVARMAQTEPGLAKELRELHGDAVSDISETLAGSLSVIEQEAAYRVQERLTLAIARSPLYPALLRMESAHGEVLALGERCPPWKRETVLVEAQKAVERLLILVRERHPPPHRCWERLTNDRECNALYFEGIAARLKFRTPLPRALARVQASKVQWAAQHGGQSLRPHLLSALLTAHADSTHPLHIAAREQPHLLERLDALAELRDTSAAHATVHAGSRTVSLEQLSPAVATVYTTVEALRGASLS